MELLGFSGARAPRASGVTTRAQAPDLAAKKRPSQARSRRTFEALVEACAWLLAERGYAGTTTNHIADRAGVNIASLYEYFPGKDAVVAQVADRLVDRVLGRLAEGVTRVLDDGEDRAVRSWIELIYDTVARERALIVVFVYQVPYTGQIPSIQTVGARILDFSRAIRTHAGGFVAEDFSSATLHLVVNLVTSTIMQLVTEPPDDVEPSLLLDELTVRVEDWIRGAAPLRSGGA